MRNPEAQQFLATKFGCLGVLTGMVAMLVVAVVVVGGLIVGIWFLRR